MNREPLYHKTIDILVQAYFNDTLIGAMCVSCAVGTLVAANMGYEVFIYGWRDKNGAIVKPRWQYSKAFLCGNSGMVNRDTWDQIESTGYPPKELSGIESAFMNGGAIGNDYNFSGLMAVVEYLGKIHEVGSGQVVRSKDKFLA